MRNAPSRVQRGVEAEAAARVFLETLGYQILHVRYRFRGGEVDLIATEGETLCFVEVRSRAGRAPYAPEETVRSVKQHRLAKAAAHFLTHVWQQPPPPCRFDVVAVQYPGPTIRLIRDAFVANDYSSGQIK